MAGGIARALLKAKSKSETKRLATRVKSKEDLDMFGEAADELYEHLKKGDVDAFKESLRSVIEIAKNED